MSPLVHLLSSFQYFVDISSALVSFPILFAYVVFFNLSFIPLQCNFSWITGGRKNIYVCILSAIFNQNNDILLRGRAYGDRKKQNRKGLSIPVGEMRT